MPSSPSAFLAQLESRAEELLSLSPPLPEQVRQNLYRGCQLDDLLTHARADQDYELMQKLVEDDQLLIKKAAHSEGYESVSRDLEQQVVPAAIARGDGPGFFRSTLRAIHCRGLAEQLADRTIVEGLLDHGRRKLVFDLANQLVDPLERVWVRARIAAAAATPEDQARELELIALEVGNAAAPDDDPSADRWSGVLTLVARQFGAQLAAHWPRWTSRLASWRRRRDDVWMAILANCLDSQVPNSGLVVQAVAQLDAALAERVGELATTPVAGQLVLAEKLGGAGGEPWRWRVRLAIWGNLVEKGGLSFSETRARMAAPLPWSAALAEAGARLWVRLDRSEIAGLLARIAGETADPELRAETLAALGVVLLEERSSCADGGSVIERIQTISKVGSRLHWALRWLAADPRLAVAPILRAVAGYLFAARYDAERDDLGRFLDLVAAHLPEELEGQLENVLRSSPAAPDLLRHLAAEARAPRLLDLLLEETERWIVVAARDEIAGFALRQEILGKLVVRLCAERASLAPFRLGASRTLPEEEEALREGIVVALGDRQLPPALLEELKELAGGISNGRAGLRARLALARRDTTLDPLEPAALFRSVASTQPIEDQLRGLGVLLETPLRPAELAHRDLERIFATPHRIFATIELVRHALDLQLAAYTERYRDLPAVFGPLPQALAEIGSDELLLQLLPELFSLAIERGGGLAELQEALLRALRAELPWTERTDALVALLCRLGPELVGRATRRQFFDRCRQAAELLAWAVRLPVDSAADGVDSLRRSWHEVLPWLIAVADRLPAWSGLALRFPNGARWTLGPLRWCLGHEPRRQEPWCARLEKWLTPAYLPQPSPTPWSAPSGQLLAVWSWLEPPQRLVVEICCLPAVERLARIATRLDLGDCEPELIAALVPLAAADGPLLERMLRTLPESLRTAAMRRLVTTGFLAPAGWMAVEAAATPELLPEIPVWKEIWQPGAVGDPEWLRSIVDLIRTGRLDAHDPRWLPIHRRLRRAERNAALSAIARSVVPALAYGGRHLGENALCWWLGAYAGIRPGRGNPEGRARLAELGPIVEEARGLARGR